MSNSLLALAVVVGIALSQPVSAKDLTSAEPAPNAGGSSLRHLPELLHQFGIHLISKPEPPNVPRKAKSAHLQSGVAPALSV